MTTTTIQAGYKQTEIGVIPEDWEVNFIEQFGTVVDGDRGHNYPNGDDFHSNGYCLFLSATNVTKTGFKFDEYQFITKEKDESLSKGKLKRGDVVLTTRGTVGNLAFYSDSIPYNHIRINSGMVLIRAENKKKIAQNYLYEICKSNVLTNQINRLSFGSAQPQLTVKGISSFQFPLPPTLAEQKLIATTLSDTDELISSLSALIAKKRRIKEGAMQELLTGKKRLAGFSGEWEVKKLGDIGEIITGSTPLTQIKDYWNGTIPWITPTDISDRKNIFNSEREISELGLESIRKLPKNTLLVTCIASIGKNAILRRNGACNQQINAIIPYSNNNVDFLYYLIEIHKKYILGNAGITATLIISKKDFSEIIFTIPLDLVEQQAIAKILSDMDSEITALEQKRDKYKLIKQGMMQQLLTGKIRLIDNG